jgi:hypothetical protein
MLNKKVLGNFLLLWVVIIGLLGAVYKSRNWMGNNPIVRQRLDRIEGFQEKQEIDGIKEKSGELSPADSSLENLRKPYSLLQDVLPVAVGKAPAPTSKSCYESDFQTRLERTGNFRQLTNNYKRGTPDSCSQPLHDMTLSFYKVEPLD